MTLSRNTGPSRPGSSRAASTARDIVKKRGDNRTYKTEKQRVYAPKRKLDLHTSYRKAPQGYTFLPVGTPDLAELCKELSRQGGLPVNVVNAKPVSKHATDPQKVSHHIHRIGYHFKAEVVADACDELGYVHHRGQFIKETDLQARNARSHLASIMGRHGYILGEPEMQETPAQVRAAIKELFPKIPDDDLTQIVDHAWKEGSRRVGTNATLQLPRRVQLATIARIRHTYTDYDQLLRAFEWKAARAMVENACLQKLIEWRGEHDEANDNELEEIVRDIIVIDDDDKDHSANGSEADDEDSTAEMDYTSDSSVEITYERVTGHNLGAEPMNEARPTSADQYQQSQRRVQEQHTLARQKIGEARERMRVPQQQPPYAQAAPYTQQGPFALSDPYAQQALVQPLSVQVPTYGARDAPDNLTIGGQIFRRIPEQGEAARLGHYDLYRPSYDSYQAPRPAPYAQYPDEGRRVTAADYSTYVEVPSSPSRSPRIPVSAHDQEVYYAMREYRRASQEVVDLTTPPPARAIYRPVHGAPAPVQQVDRGHSRGYWPG